MSLHRPVVTRLLLLLSLICTSLITTGQPAIAQPTDVVVAPTTQAGLPTDRLIVKYRSVNAALSVPADSAATLQRRLLPMADGCAHGSPMRHRGGGIRRDACKYLMERALWTAQSFGEPTRWPIARRRADPRSGD